MINSLTCLLPVTFFVGLTSLKLVCHHSVFIVFFKERVFCKIQITLVTVDIASHNNEGGLCKGKMYFRIYSLR